MKILVTQSCPTLCNPMGCGLPGSSVHGILQARILEWVAISFSRGSSLSRDRTLDSRIAGRHFNLTATRVSLNQLSTESVISLYLMLKDWIFPRHTFLVGDITPDLLFHAHWFSGEKSASQAGDLGLIPGSGRSPGEGNGNPLQYSCLENLMDRGA